MCLEIKSNMYSNIKFLGCMLAMTIPCQDLITDYIQFAWIKSWLSLLNKCDWPRAAIVLGLISNDKPLQTN